MDRSRALGALGATLAIAGLVTLLVSTGDPEDLSRIVQEDAGPTSVPAPTALSVRVAGGGVVVDWTGVHDPAASGYRVERDGEIVESAAARTRFVDTDVVPGERYRYDVRTVWRSGETSRPVRGTIRVPTPPVSLASLDGLFSVDLDERSHFGYGVFVGETGAQWRFSSACRVGPCAVAWSDLDHPGLSTTLRPDGRSFVGDAAGRLEVPCGTSVPTTDVGIRLRIVGADVVDGTWRATELRGSVEQRTPPQLGCLSAGVTYAFTASLLPSFAQDVVEVDNAECRSAGSGFVVDPGVIVTNAHVVAGASQPTVLLDGRRIRTTVVAFDPRSDLALLGVRGDLGTELRLQDETSDPVRADLLGFPGGASLSSTPVRVRAAFDRGPSLAGRFVPLDGYVIRGDIRHGHSGGPIVLPDGTVVGVVSAGNERGRGYAVAAGEVLDLIRSDRDLSDAVWTGPCFDLG